MPNLSGQQKKKGQVGHIARRSAPLPAACNKCRAAAKWTLSPRCRYDERQGPTEGQSVRKPILFLVVLGLAVLAAAQTTDPVWAIVWISIALGGLAAAAPVSWSLPSQIAPSGGVGTVGGAIIGALIMGVLNNGMSILGINVDWQQAIKGVVLLIAVLFDISSKNKQK